MAAIPIIIFDAGFQVTEEGALFNPSIEFFSPAQMSFYSLVAVGWHRCPLDYSVYVNRDALGRKIVVPAIYLTDDGVRPPRKKFRDHSLKFTKKQIEAFIQSHLSVYNDIRLQRDAEFKNLTHDLRAISTEIYHSAINARDNINMHNPTLLEKINLIINAQQMMSMRLDIIDYESGLASDRPKDFIEPYPKVDKVVRCFAGKFKHRNMDPNFEGKIRDFIFGPPIFEIVPFVIVENAIKYAPYGSFLNVKFEEKEDKIIIRFESLGPRISKKEKERIFEKAYRGEAVKSQNRGGSGIGLFAAKTIVESHFDGQIFVNQLDDKRMMGGIDYQTTRFTIIIPSIEYNNRNKKPTFGRK